MTLLKLALQSRRQKNIRGMEKVGEGGRSTTRRTGRCSTTRRTGMRVCSVLLRPMRKDGTGHLRADVAIHHHGSVHSVSRASIAVVVSLLATLVLMSGGWVVTVASIDAGTTVKSLLHLGLGAGTTSEVSITSTGRKGRGTSGKVVVRYRGESTTAAVAPGEAHQVVVTRRVERRRIGGHPTVSGETAFVLCGLPVDGLEAILELSGGTELPLANNGPDDGAATNGRGEYDKDCQGGMREAGCTKLRIARSRGRSGRDMARECDRIDRDRLTVAGCRRDVFLRRRCRGVRGRRGGRGGGGRDGRGCSGGSRTDGA